MANILNPLDFINAKYPFPMGVRYALIAGAAANVELTVSGIRPQDKIIFVMAFAAKVVGANIDMNDVTALTTIVSDDTIIIDAVSTVDHYLWIYYYAMT